MKENLQTAPELNGSCMNIDSSVWKLVLPNQSKYVYYLKTIGRKKNTSIAYDKLYLFVNCFGVHNYSQEIGDWVLCRIFIKKRSIESDNNTTPPRQKNAVTNNVEVAEPRFFEFFSVHHNSVPAPIHSSTLSSCSSSNNVEEVSSPNHEQTSD